MKKIMNISATFIIIAAYLPKYISYIEDKKYIWVIIYSAVALSLAMAFITKIDFYTTIGVSIVVGQRFMMLFGTEYTEKTLFLMLIYIIIMFMFIRINYVSRQQINDLEWKYEERMLRENPELLNNYVFQKSPEETVSQSKYVYTEEDMNRAKKEQHDDLFQEFYKEVDKIREAAKNNETVDYFNGCKSKEAIKKRYIKLSQAFHPDNDYGDEELMKELNKQYEDVIDKFS